MGLVRDKELVKLEDGLLQTGEWKVKSSKREKKLEKETKRQQWNVSNTIQWQRLSADKQEHLNSCKWTFVIITASDKTLRRRCGGGK